MSESEMGFRTAPLGFRREDVLAFIETETTRRAQAEQTLAEREAALARVEQEKQDADRAAAAMLAERDRLLAEQETYTRTTDSLREQLAEAQTQTADARALLAQTQEQAESLQQALEELRAENARLEATCAAFDEDRRRLAEIELCARARADEIQAHAEEDARCLIREAEALAGETLSAIEAAKEDYRKALSAARREGEAALDRAAGALGRLDQTADALTRRMERKPASPQTAVPVDASQPDQQTPCRREGKTLAEVLGGLRGGK